MRIEPRQHIFEIWKALLRASVRDSTWRWGGVYGSNPISDAEQLLCLLYPATEIEGLAIDRPDDTKEDVAGILNVIGANTRIPWEIVKILSTYVDSYIDANGNPVFWGGTYLHKDNGGRTLEGQPTDIQDWQKVDVLDAYSISVTLCLAALGFMNMYRQHPLHGRAIRERIDALHEKVNQRLTAAMIGLQRSFVVSWYHPTDPEWATILTRLNQEGANEDVVVENLRRQLIRVRARLRDAVGVTIPADPVLKTEPPLFECGWTWGIAEGAAAVDSPVNIANCPGIAEARPYLYFTGGALNAINELLSDRIRELNLLNAEQRQLAESLRVRWELTQRYWSTIARFGGRRWALEDVPWQTSDGLESDYYTLLVTAVLIQEFSHHRQGSDNDLERIADVLEELARRARITQRVLRNDPARALHVPGLQVLLDGTGAIGPELYWYVADFAPLLMKRALQAASLAGDVGVRNRLMGIAEASMDHLNKRKLRTGRAAQLWDAPDTVLTLTGELTIVEKPSWYLTERVVEGLVSAARMYEQPAPRSASIANRALELLMEANHLYNQLLLNANANDRSKRARAMNAIADRLDRASESIKETPGVAHVLASDALLQLDGLRAARSDATRSQ